MSDTSAATMSFDRMRSMLVRAAEIRDSEQQQIFDALDEIHARLSPLESIGSVRKRLSELPDRTEMSVLAERLDETLAKLEAQDGAIAGLARTVEAVVDRLAKPFAELGGRLDGMAGRFEGVAGRMDGLEDRIAGLHKRIDDMDHHLDKQDGRLDGMPAAVHGPVRERLENLEAGVRGRLEESDGRVDQLNAALDAQTTRLDPAERLDRLGARIETLGDRLDALEGAVGGRLGEVSDALTARLAELGGSLGARPDVDSLTSLVRTANEESERRHAGQLDEAMATFAELILGGGATTATATAPAPQRPAQRRARKAAAKARDAEHDEPETPAEA